MGTSTPAKLILTAQAAGTPQNTYSPPVRQVRNKFVYRGWFDVRRASIFIVGNYWSSRGRVIRGAPQAAVPAKLILREDRGNRPEDLTTGKFWLQSFANLPVVQSSGRQLWERCVMLSIRVRCCRIVQATKGNFDWLVIAGYVYDLPAVIVPDMIWAESTMVVDILSLQSGEPSDAVEHATWLFGDGIIARACRLIRNDYEVLSLTRGVWPLF